MVVAKHAAAHEELARQFKDREVRKSYLAIVYGDVRPDSGEIKLPIGRHPVDRKRMSTTTRKARAAKTLWKVRERLIGLTLLELDLKTGRTHQVRVHCTSIGHPVVGDPVYRPRKLLRNIDAWLSDHPRPVIDSVKSASRQMLHAWRLSLIHPQSRQPMTFESSLPADMQELIVKLRRKG